MTWFADIFGFEEGSFPVTRWAFRLENAGTEEAVLVSKANGARFEVGTFEYPTLEELRGRLDSAGPAGFGGGLRFSHLAGDVKQLHQDGSNAGAVFQVASQFNCLEMIGPDVRPENGVTIYQNDRTQGPACALECPAALVYRNYLVNGKGQSGKRQLDMLSDVAAHLENRRRKHWEMRNGYCLPMSPWSIGELRQRLSEDAGLPAALESKLRVGIHWSTQVRDQPHRVCQVFCSALPLAYARSVPAADWQPFACLVLRAAYAATLAAAALLARSRRRRVAVFLTALGGGSFGNKDQWIADALSQALETFAQEALDVRLVHFRAIPVGVWQGIAGPKRKADGGGEPPAMRRRLAAKTATDCSA